MYITPHLFAFKANRLAGREVRLRYDALIVSRNKV